MYTEDAWEAFCRDIPESARDDALTAICEAAHDEHHKSDCVSIIERDRHDATNVEAQGVFTREGKEHVFIVRDGNWNGTELLDWDGGGEFVPHQPTVWDVAPSPTVVAEALLDAERARRLLIRWDALLSRPHVGKLASKYAYDRYFQPGSLTENHYKNEAEKLGLVIVPCDEAQSIRSKLKSCGLSGSPYMGGE